LTERESTCARLQAYVNNESESPKAIRRATILEVVKVLAVEESTRYDLGTRADRRLNLVYKRKACRVFIVYGAVIAFQKSEDETGKEKKEREAKRIIVHCHR